MPRKKLPFMHPPLTDTSCRITYPDGHTLEFESVEKAAEETGLKVATIKSHCKFPDKEFKDKFKCEYLNPKMLLKVRNKANRSKGNQFERDLINRLKEEGFEGCVSSRQHSREMDKNKIDICDPTGKLPVYIQAKYKTSSPSHIDISNECPFKDKPFVTIWKKSTKDGTKSPGTIAMMDIDFFIELLKTYTNANSSCGDIRPGSE